MFIWNLKTVILFNFYLTFKIVYLKFQQECIHVKPSHAITIIKEFSTLFGFGGMFCFVDGLFLVHFPFFFFLFLSLFLHRLCV